MSTKVKICIILFLLIFSILQTSCNQSDIGSLRDDSGMVTVSITPSPTPTEKTTITPAHTPSRPTSGPDRGKIIEFEDTYFRELLLDAIRRETGEDRQYIYEDDLKGIRSLSFWLSPNFVIELSGFVVEYEKEILQDGQTTLKKTVGSISHDDYWDTQYIKTLNDLKYFPELRELRLSGIRANDISPIYALDNLESLNITYCYYIDDISGLTQLKNLKKLEIGGWSLIPTELKGWDDNGWNDTLIKHGITDCKIDISFLKDMANLEWMFVDSFDLDLSLISELFNLKVLAITNNLASQTDLSKIANLNALQYIALEHTTGICGVESLSKMSELEYLYLSKTNIDADDAIVKALGLDTSVDYTCVNTKPWEYLYQ